MNPSSPPLLDRQRNHNPAWPLTIPFVGLPIWWLLGGWQLVVLAMAIPMGIYLFRQRTVAVPRGFGIWLLWIAWLLTGVLVLQVDAPSAVSGVNPNRYISFMYRYAWYVAATIVCLYVVNTRHLLSTQTIMRAVSWLFVWFSLGGILGLVAPGIDIKSVVQSLMPDSIAGNPFVNSLFRVRVAQVQEVLGPPLPRPSAPFFYTNEWGFATAITLPFFVAAWWARGWRWRIAMVAVLTAGLYAVVVSLNRGVWIAILAAVALAVLQAALQGRFKAIVVSAAVILCALVMLLFSPLSDVLAGRLDNGDSDEVRGNLAITAVSSAAEGSPIVGFGSTRDVAGTFSSIAGGATELCPRCEAPPLGTHGQLWLVVFGAGFVGVALFAGFIAMQFLRTVKVGSTYAMASSASLLMLLVTLPVYNSVGLPIYLGLMGVGLLAREGSLSLPKLEELVKPTMRQLPYLIALFVLGGLVGQAVNVISPVPVAATQRVLVPATELVPVPGVRASTLDSEAELVRSAGVIEEVAEMVGVPEEEVRRSLDVSAEPNTRVLLVTYRSGSAETAMLGAETAVAAFVQRREGLLNAAGVRMQERYEQRQSELEVLQRTLRTAVLATPSERLQIVLADIEGEWSSVNAVLETLTDGTAQARAISGAVIDSDGGLAVVRVASGLALGLLVGILLTRVYDRRYVVLGKRRLRRAPGGVPVIATTPAGGAREALAAVSHYIPVAGVLAGSRSRSALAMASEMDSLLPEGGHGGTRVVVIVDHQSRAGRVREMLKEVANVRVNPVGLIFETQKCSTEGFIGINQSEK